VTHPYRRTPTPRPSLPRRATWWRLLGGWWRGTFRKMAHRSTRRRSRAEANLSEVAYALAVKDALDKLADWYAGGKVGPRPPPAPRPAPEGPVKVWE
jgi:hypothetical protein